MVWVRKLPNKLEKIISKAKVKTSLVMTIASIKMTLFKKLTKMMNKLVNAQLKKLLMRKKKNLKSKNM